MKRNLFVSVKDNVRDCLQNNKIKFFTLMFILFVALVTGIIVAIKCYSNASIADLSHYGLVSLEGGAITSSFFSRLLSLILVMALLLVFSLTKFCLPLAYLVLAYRTYLLGLNLTLMFILYGFPGIILSFLIALPCQLICLFVLSVYYIFLCDSLNGPCCVSRLNMRYRFKCFLFTLAVLFAICLVESLLIIIFNGQVILVL